MRDISPESAQLHHLPAEGAEVIEVIAESAAEAAGIRVGDVIVRVDGKPVANVAEAAAALQKSHLEFSLDVIRDGAVIGAKVALDD